MHPPPETPPPAASEQRCTQALVGMAVSLDRIREQLTRLRDEIDRGRHASIPPRAD